MTATRPARPAGRRALILDAAAELFAERGFAGVAIDDIGAAVGITGPGIYRHFASKEALLGEILVAVSERLLAGGTERSRTGGEPAAALAALVEFHVDFALGSPELITVQDQDFAHLSADDARRVRQLQRRYVELWVAAVTRVHPRVDDRRARAATHAVFGLLNSTPHSAIGATLGRGDMAPLLRTMALAAIGAIYGTDGTDGTDGTATS